MTGIEEVWETVVEYTQRLGASGELEAKRKNQNIDWLRFLVQQGLKEWFYKKPYIQKMIPPIEKEVAEGTIAPTTAADRLLALLDEQ
jgi:LAO/AO transport system kinase